MHLSRALLAVVALAAAACTGPAPPEADLQPSATQRRVIESEAGSPVALMAGQTLYLNAIGPADIEAPADRQTQSALDRLGEALAAAGLDPSQVVNCHVHLADMANYSAMNAAYGSYFADGSYPARTTVEFPGLPGGAAIQLECTAYSDSDGIEIVRPAGEAIPAAMGPYSPAVQAGPIVYLSGQGGRDPATGELAATAAGQAEQTLRNVGTILEAAGLGFDNAVQAGVYLAPGTASTEVDAAFDAVFAPGGAPARTDVPLSALPGGIAVELSFVAARDPYVTRLFGRGQRPSARSSPASLTGGIVYLSAVTGEGEDFRSQLLNALEQHKAALQLAFLDLPQVVRVRAYLAELGDLDQLHDLLAESLPATQPALTAVQARLPEGSRVALEAVAVQ